MKILKTKPFTTPHMLDGNEYKDINEINIRNQLISHCPVTQLFIKAKVTEVKNIIQVYLDYAVFVYTTSHIVYQ